MPISHETTVREILRIRPKAVAVVDENPGFKFWRHLDSPLSEFCETFSLDLKTLLARIAALPPEPQERNWSEIPLYHLVDRLTLDHQEFRDRDMPEIERLLFTPDPSVFPEDYPVESIQHDFHSFKVDFFLHMEEEEGFLFPKVLRTEASVNHAELIPESFKGSVSVYSENLLHTPEVRIKEMLFDLRLKMNWAGPKGKSFPLLEKVESRLKSLENRLIHHAELESQVILPRTRYLEEQLNRRARKGFNHEGDNS